MKEMFFDLNCKCTVDSLQGFYPSIIENTYE